MKKAFYETHDLSCAAALAALGIPFNLDPPFVKIRTTENTIYRFYFATESLCGKYKTGEMMAAWNSESFHTENPEHPFAYIKCAFKNRDGLLDVVKKSDELIVIEKNGKIAIISKNASKNLQNKIFGQI